METTQARETANPPDPAHRNEVHIIGRVSSAPEVRALRDGELVVWRVAVERPRPPDEPRRSDWLTCTTAEAEIGATARDLRVGDVVELHGRLRRRFWRSRQGPVTPLEVEVSGAAVLRAAREPAPRTSAAPGP